MTEDLLAREKEFHRLNKELEKKARDLMKEVDSVINAETAHSEKDKWASETETATNKCNFQVPIKRTSSSLHNFDPSLSLKPKSDPERNDINEILSKKENGSANKAITNFLTAKIDILQNELQTMRLEYKKKCDYCKDLEVEHKKLTDLKGRAQTEVESLKDVIKKLENTSSELLSQSQALRSENSTLKRDLDTVRKQMKASNQQLSNYDLRLNRSSEANEKLKATIKCCNTEEKELRSQIRRLQEDKALAIKSLEKQRSELVHAFKKQVLLIDNLKKQNACLVAQGRIQFLEDDFLKLLDGKPESL